MRKILIAALAALTALAVAAVAIAQTPGLALDVTATVTPTKAGTKKKPKSEQVDLDDRQQQRDSKTSASRSRSRFPKTLKLSTQGPEDLLGRQARQPGQGRPARGALARPAPARPIAGVNPHPNPASAEVQRHGLRGRHEPARLLPRAAAATTIRTSGQALPAKISAIKGNKVSARSSTSSIPRDLPAAGPGRVLRAGSRSRTTSASSRARTRSSSSIGCPKTREHPIGVKVTYVPNNPGRAEGRPRPLDGAGCSGKSL